MRIEDRVRAAAIAVAAIVLAPVQAPAQTIEYVVERYAGTNGELEARFAPWQRAILQKLNRADAAHLRRLAHLVVPAVWYEDELRYSPFPPFYAAATHLPTLLVVDQPMQAFAAYDAGRLVRWGPVSSGTRAHPTPNGWFSLTWRSRGRHSTDNPDWYMKWYFNFDNARGLALHAYGLPGRPASHACVRLLETDAIWIHEWGRGWRLGPRGEIVERGTPILIIGQYAHDAAPPWRSATQPTRRITLPDTLVEQPLVRPRSAR